MENAEKLKIASHIAAKVADEDFRNTLNEAMGMVRIGMFQVMARIMIQQQGIEFSEEAERLALISLAVGHSLGRDLAKAEAMEASAAA